jgi:hypothetical protein
VFGSVRHKIPIQQLGPQDHKQHSKFDTYRRSWGVGVLILEIKCNPQNAIFKRRTLLRNRVSVSTRKVFVVIELANSTPSAEQEKRQRRAAKAGNKYGNPIQLKSKILAAVPDPRSPSSALLVAESAGAVRLVNLDVCELDSGA